jgi:hypothetical protein
MPGDRVNMRLVLVSQKIGKVPRTNPAAIETQSACPTTTPQMVFIERNMSFLGPILCYTEIRANESGTPL